jgi:chemotaxis protein methyltransferase CheR
MYETIGLSFNTTKKSLVSSRLGPRLQKLNLTSYPEYIELLGAEESHGELQVAIDLLTTNETYFFREPLHFDFLEKYVLSTKSSRPLDIWSAAASFGDEAYSVAMLLSELTSKGQCEPGWSILATDISHRVLMNAKEAIFPKDRLRNVSEERLKRYCLKGQGSAEGLIMLNETVRNQVKFGQLNLTKAFNGIGPFDVIFLRNVLIYFDAQTRQHVVKRVAKYLRPGGLLFLGTTEGRIPEEKDLRSLTTGVFEKMAVSSTKCNFD